VQAKRGRDCEVVQMTFNLEGDEALSAAIAGLSKIAELIAAVPTGDRVRFGGC